MSRDDICCNCCENPCRCGEGPDGPQVLRIIIAGSRGFNNWRLLYRKMDHLTQNVTDDIEVVSGTAKGADTWGERWATDRGHDVKRMPAHWRDEFGRLDRSAGYKRNERMAKYANACVCFWDGNSRGTMHMINLAKKHKLQLRVVRY